MLSWLKGLIPADFILRLWWHRLIGFFAAVLYGFPGHQLNIIGITGTDGKSSTVEFVASILKKKDLKVGVASTIRFQIGEETWSNRTHKTTLGRFQLQKMLRRMADAKCDVVVLEVSSHALEQGRLVGVPFTVAALSNISHEHLDFHRTMENYISAKAKLFRNVEKNQNITKYDSTICLNIDDKYFDRFSKFDVKNKLYYSLSQQEEAIDISHKDIFARIFDIKVMLDGTKFVLKVGGIKKEIKLKVLGSFQVANAVLAFLTTVPFLGKLDEKTLNIVKEGLQSVPRIPGRTELVDTDDKLGEKNGIICMIDFAITERAVTCLYRTLGDMADKKHVISVFGACGNRDKEKRPRIAKIAQDMTDRIIICDDETYGEDTFEIRTDLLSGICKKDMLASNERKNKMLSDDFYQYSDKIYEIGNRQKAIEYAIKIADTGDLVVVTGMGDFDMRMLSAGLVPWDERKVIKEALFKKYKK